MTTAEIHQLFERARARTSAKSSQINTVIQDGNDWLILFQNRGEELLIRVHVEPGATPDSLLEDMQRQLMMLS